MSEQTGTRLLPAPLRALALAPHQLLHFLLHVCRKPKRPGSSQTTTLDAIGIENPLMETQKVHVFIVASLVPDTFSQQLTANIKPTGVQPGGQQRGAAALHTPANQNL